MEVGVKWSRESELQLFFYNETCELVTFSVSCSEARIYCVSWVCRVSKMEQRTLKRHKGGLPTIGFLFLFPLLLGGSSANVVLIGNNISQSFDDIEANFAPAIRGPGACGVLQLAEPFDACTQLTNKAVPREGVYASFALIIRGTCTFEKKVRNAQAAGFSAAIVYNNEDSSDLVSMAGNSDGVTIHAVFVSKVAGEMLLKHAGDPNVEFWLVPSYENTAWSVMAIAFISLLAICAVLATCFFVRRHRLRHVGLRSRVREFHGMSGRLVKALPSMIFSSVVDDNCTSETCAICLEDYKAGEKLRILPCHHKFHLLCIDSWLTMWRTFCPVCKRDARISTGEPPASENTPLLSSSLSVSAPFLSVGASSQSSPLGSPSMLIPSGSLRSRATSSYVVSYSGASRNGSSYLPQSIGSHCISPVSSRNSVSTGNTSSVSHHLSFQSLNVQPSLFSCPNSLDMYGTSSQMTPQSFSSRYASFIPGSYSASPHIANYRSRPPRVPRMPSYSGVPSYCGSLTSISPFASTRSLPVYQDETR